MGYLAKLLADGIDGAHRLVELLDSLVKVILQIVQVNRLIAAIIAFPGQNMHVKRLSFFHWLDVQFIGKVFATNLILAQRQRPLPGFKIYLHDFSMKVLTQRINL